MFPLETVRPGALLSQRRGPSPPGQWSRAWQAPDVISRGNLSKRTVNRGRLVASDVFRRPVAAKDGRKVAGQTYDFITLRAHGLARRGSALRQRDASSYRVRQIIPQLARSISQHDYAEDPRRHGRLLCAAWAVAPVIGCRSWHTSHFRALVLQYVQ